MPSCQARGAARLGPHLAHAEEDLDQPVVLEGLDAPGPALIEPALVGLGSGGRGVVAVDPSRGLRRHRRVRREVADVGHQRRVSQAAGAGRRCRRGARRVALLPGDHGARRHHPLVGVERAQLDVGVEPRVELHRADGDVVGPEVVDGGDDRPGDIVTGLGLVPVGRAVVGPVRRARPEGVGPATRAHGARRVEQHLPPGVEGGAGSVGRQHGQVGGEAGGHRLEIAVPAAAQGPAVQADRLLVEGVEGRDQQRRAVGPGEQQRPAGGRTVGEQEPAVEGGSGVAREPELAVLEHQPAQAVGLGAVGPLGRGEGGPGHRGLVERAGGDATQIGQGLDAEHHQRAIGVGADRAAHLAVDDGDRCGLAPRVGDPGGRARGGGPRRAARAEPVLAVEPDRHGAVGPHVDGQTPCCAQVHARSLSRKASTGHRDSAAGPPPGSLTGWGVATWPGHRDA